MSGLNLEDRLQINDLIVGYCNAVDVIGDIDGVCACFTQDAVYDLSGFGMGQFSGVTEIRGFFSSVFPTVAHSAHFVTNIAVRPIDADTASAAAYVLAWSVSKAGDKLEVKAKYNLQLARTPQGWKFARMGVSLLLPGV